MRPYSSGLSIKKGMSAEHPVGYEALVAAAFRRVADDLAGKDPLARWDAELYLQTELVTRCEDLDLPYQRVLQRILQWAEELGYRPPLEILDLREE